MKFRDQIDRWVEQGFFASAYQAWKWCYVAFLSDSVLDNGLAYIITNGTRIDICTQQPANYTEATSTYTKGNKTGLTCTGPADHTSGRKATVPAITDGAVTGDGTVSHWALTKPTTTTELLAAQALTASQAVTNGNTFTLDAIIIAIPDPVA